MFRACLRFFKLLLLLVYAVLPVLFSGCSSTKSLREGEYLLRANKVCVHHLPPSTDKGVMEENLNSLIVQKPNSRILGLPVKLYLYNLRREKYATDTANYQLRSETVEKPVVYDSSLMRRSRQAMGTYLYNAGFFYARVEDTVRFRGQKAFVTYEVEPGKYYTLDSNTLDVDDSAIAALVQADSAATLLRPGTPFSMMLLEEERIRITNTIRNSGYYQFSNDNISFQIDTLSGNLPVAPATDSLSLTDTIRLDSSKDKGHLSVLTRIRLGNEPGAYQRYTIGRIRVYPDFRDRSDYTNPAVLRLTYRDVEFRYHQRYIKEEVIYRNIYFSPGKFFSQDDYDQTITRLNELGVFQYVRISLNEDTTITDRKVLRVSIYMNPTPRYDFNTNFEVSSASTYTLGSAVGFGIRNRNFLKGANQLSLNASTGIELIYDESLGSRLSQRFFTRSRNVGVNAILNMPRFLVPFRLPRATKGNLPRTVVSIGTTLFDRTDYFRLINSTASFTYSWQQNKSRLWEFSPLFVNVFKLPYTSPGFQQRLDTNLFLANSYREVTIAGESLTFTFNNNEAKRGKNYSYLRLSVEEAGGLLTGLTALSGGLRDRISERFAQYLRFDADGRHFITFAGNTLALRLAAGIGVPYGNSRTLPYVKQYFAGGAYSIRGWRVRTLGPGSYYNPNDVQRSYQIDRTGDIRLEANAEYRQELFRLFAGAVKVGGAVFTDAGNIWLAKPDSSYPGGAFQLRNVPQEIAVSSGLGVRLNFGDFITLRVDGAIPVRRPGTSGQGGGWMLDEIYLRDRAWRRENLVLSFAIGYPF